MNTNKLKQNVILLKDYFAYFEKVGVFGMDPSTYYQSICPSLINQNYFISKINSYRRIKFIKQRRIV